MRGRTGGAGRSPRACAQGRRRKKSSANQSTPARAQPRGGRRQDPSARVFCSPQTEAFLFGAAGADEGEAAYGGVGGGAGRGLFFGGFLGFAGVSEDVGLDAVLAGVEIGVAAAAGEKVFVAAS